ncbi:MAG: segregation and condensation protein A [Hydrogenophilaceae bacterium]|nr:segregation and condensation protein A [Hydrogenophilaceae bacterium]
MPSCLENQVSDAELTKEQQILRAMRKTLGSIVKDAAPRDGQPSPLSEATVENIRMCFGLIATREAELADALGLSRNERPFYSDEEPNAKVLQFSPTSGKKPN